jgi:hypothetical protein
MRRTFVSKLAAGQASDATIMSLAGHLSRRMMEKYSHIHNEANREAVSALDGDFAGESPQIPPRRLHRVERSVSILGMVDAEGIEPSTCRLRDDEKLIHADIYQHL